MIQLKTTQFVYFLCWWVQPCAISSIVLTFAVIPSPDFYKVKRKNNILVLLICNSCDKSPLFLLANTLGSGYILGVLAHTTAWDQLWGGNIFLRLYIRSSALPCLAAVWLGFWNSGHVVLKLSIRSSASPRSAAVWLGFWNSEQVVLKWSIWARLCLAQQQSDWASGTLTMWF